MQPISRDPTPWARKSPQPLRHPIRIRQVPTGVLTVFLAALAATAIGFLATAHYARKETLQGVLVPKAGLAPVVAMEGGVIIEVLAQEGQSVRRGEPLLAMSSDKVLSDGALMGTLLDQASAAQTEAVGRQAEAEQLILGSSLEDATIRRKALEKRHELLLNDRAVTSERLKLAQDRVDRASGLAASGYVSQIQLQSWRDAALQANLALSANAQDIEEVETSIRRLDVERQQARFKTSQAQATLDSSRASVLERRAAQMPQQRVMITATVDGQIASMSAKPGAVFAAGANIGAIVPKGSPLEVELLAPSKAVGFIRAGDPVKLMYDAFPYQSFGMASGRVLRVSQAPTTGRSGGQAAEETYAIRVSLDRQNVEAYGQTWALMPGMNVSGIVVLERRSALSWLLDPVLALSKRAGV